MKFNVVNLGCKVNRVESDSVAAGLLALGGVAVDADADIVVVNTCTVTGEADKKARKAVRHALGANPRARVLVSGCASAINTGEFASMDDRVKVVSRLELETSLRESLGAQTAPAGGAGNIAFASDVAPEEGLRVGAGFNTRVNLKIQDGCDNACTYCIVHVARGAARSVSADVVIADAVAYACAGVREIVLTGINIGSYRDGENSLPQLLEALLAATRELPSVESPVRFRISSIEPQDVTPELIDVVAKSAGRVCRHMHLPLQSGSAKVLAEMERRYTAREFEALVRTIREKIPAMSLSTDIIVGFPGETEEDFADTVSLAKRCGFSKIHVFPYSRRAGTPAAERADQVPDEVKRLRAAALRKLSDELRAQDRALRADGVELALVETNCALTESYYEVPIPKGAAVGSLVAVSMGQATGALSAAGSKR